MQFEPLLVPINSFCLSSLYINLALSGYNVVNVPPTPQHEEGKDSGHNVPSNMSLSSAAESEYQSNT